jgi:hypothetical protein
LPQFFWGGLAVGVGGQDRDGNPCLHLGPIWAHSQVARWLSVMKYMEKNNRILFFMGTVAGGKGQWNTRDTSLGTRGWAQGGDRKGPLEPRYLISRVNSGW